MKKIILLIMLTQGLSFSYSKSLDYIQSGEYAYYIDSRGAMEFFRGYCLFRMENGQDCIISRNVDLKTKKEKNFLFFIDDNEKGMPKIVDVKGISNIDLPQYLQSMVDFLNYTNLYIKNKDKIKCGTKIIDPWENYTLIFSFDQYLPFFKFYDISSEKNRAMEYTLNCAGIIDDNSIEEFMKIEPRNNKSISRNKGEIIIEAADSKEFNLNGVHIFLDENWEYGNSLGSDSCWLPITCKMDSQITIEKITDTFLLGKNMDEIVITKLFILASGSCVDYSTFQTSIREGKTYIKYLLIDNDGYENYQLLIIKGVNSYFLVMNFSTFTDIFYSNKEYYERIISKISF